ncbi:MAG: hypothetical protein ACRYGK_10715 [Janthinobacterium lividum]
MSALLGAVPWAYRWLAIVLLALATFGAGMVKGKSIEQSKQAIIAGKAAEAANTAILARTSANQALAAKQQATNDSIVKVKNDELTKVRLDLAIAGRLRIGTAICDRSAGLAETTGAGGGNGADTGGGLVREDVGRDIDALKMKVEEALATGRAAQEFIKANGLAQ